MDDDLLEKPHSAKLRKNDWSYTKIAKGIC